MDRGKIRYDNLRYPEFLSLLATLAHDALARARLQTKVLLHTPEARSRYQFMVRPNSKALRVTVLLENASDPANTSIATRLRLRYTESRANDVRLSEEVTLEPGLTAG